MTGPILFFQCPSLYCNPTFLRKGLLYKELEEVLDVQQLLTTFKYCLGEQAYEQDEKSAEP